VEIAKGEQMGPSPFKKTSRLRLARVALFVLANSVPFFASAQSIITTVAGGGPANGVSAVAAGLPRPTSVAIDNLGNLYFISSDTGQVYKVDNSRQLSLIAGNCISGIVDGVPALGACLQQAERIAVDATGNIFVADGSRNLVRRIDAATGIIATVAGKTGVFSYSGDGGPATSAGLGEPQGVTVDNAGNVFIADTNSQRIRRVDVSTGIITTVAGNGTAGFNGDGIAATSAELNYPRDVAVDSLGNLFIADINNSRVRRVDALTGIITTAATGAPVGVSVDSSGNCYFTDEFTNTVKRIDGKTFLVTIVAGNGVSGSTGDGGPAVAASLNLSNLNAGLSVDGAGNIFIPDTNNFRIREVLVSTGVITTVAGNGTPGDGGQATTASLGIPEDVAVDGAGSLFIADQQNQRIRRVDARTGIITTVAGGGLSLGGDGGPATNASLSAVSSVAVDSLGNLFIGTLGVVRRVDVLTGTISTVAGMSTTFGFSGDGGPATSATLSCCTLRVALDKSGSLFIADQNNNRIRRVDAVSGIITTVAGDGTTGFNGDGIPATSATLSSPVAVAVDTSGNVFIADVFNNRIRRVDNVTGLISTVAGNGNAAFAGDGALATSASIYWPQGLAFDGAGNLFIADWGNYRIRRVDAATGVISTVAGNGSCCFGGDGGPATSGILDEPRGIAIDPFGNLFIADVFNNRIRRVTALGPPDILTLVSGNNQISVAGRTLSGPLVVKVTNASGNPVIGMPITFAVTAGGGTLTGGVSQLGVNTDAGGLASVTLNLGSTPGPNNVSASAVGLSGSPISFTETGQPQPSISVRPILVAFGNVPVLTSSKQTVTITSTGQGPLTINSISIPPGSYFALGSLPSFPLVLAPSGIVSFNVTFSPLTTGPASATVTITSNAQTSPTLVTMTGNGVVTTNCVSLPSGMVGWWAGDDTANDFLGTNPGTLQGGAAFATGEVGGAFSFNGTNASVQVPNSLNLLLGAGEITVDAWINSPPWDPSVSDVGAIVTKSSPSFPYQGYSLRTRGDNRVEFTATDCGTGACGFSDVGLGGAKQPLRSMSVVADGKWHHVAGVRRADGTREIYVDGVLENTRVEGMWNTDSGNPLYIGQADGTNDYLIRGLVDEVEVFNRALSAAEIGALFTAGSGGKCKPGSPPSNPPPPTTSSYFSDPSPTEADLPTEIVLHKELSGIANYGRVDGASDILYTGQSATWHFTLPSSIDPATIRSAFFRVSVIADDHGSGIAIYSLASWTNGIGIYSGPANVPHGSPSGTRFTNWIQEDFGTSVIPPDFTISLQNQSSATGGDWIAVDWVELHLELSTSATPATITLASGNNQSGVAGQALANPLVVKVTDNSGNPVSGKAITFAVTAGGGTLTGGATQLVVNADASGLASVTLNLGLVPGPNTVTATAVGLSGSPITFSATGQLQFDISVAPNSVAFGGVPITTSSSTTVTITSTGHDSLAVNSIALTGSFFTLRTLPSMPLTLAPSGTLSFNVTFAPLGTISSTATITITSNAASSPTLVTVTGNGVPLPLPPATSITAATDQTVYHRGQPVQISGSLSASGGAGISNIPVNVQVSTNGTVRTLTAYTDALGTYRAVFQPAANDGGAFTVTAVGTSGGATQTASANFRILGLLMSPISMTQDVLMGSTITVPFDAQNLGDASLNGLTYSVTVTPAGSLAVTLPQSQANLTPGSSVTIPVTLTAPAGNPPSGPVSVVLNVAGTDTTSSLTETGSAMIVATLRPSVTVPVLIPSTASVGVNPGGSLTQTFTVRNTGYAPINNATVTLQSPGALPWIALGNSGLGTIVPGDARQFEISISPSASVPVGNYSVPFTVSGGTNQLQGTLNISVTQLSMGSAAFVVNDDIGANVSGVTITLFGKTNGKIFQGVSDSTGLLTINGVDAGDYSYVAVADSHDPGSGNLTVTAGSTAQVNVLLSFNVVTLTFIVTPTTIVDQYNVTLNITYSTTTPKPALQVVPSSLDFSFFPEDTTSGRYACNLSVTNTHPTASVRNVLLDASQLDISQPIGQRLRVFFANDAQIYQVGNLAGKGTVNVPCYAVIDGGTVPNHSVGNIVVQANYDFSLAGQVLQGTTKTNVPVTYTRPSDLTYNAISFVYDKRTDPANPVLVYNGNGFVYDVKSNRPPVFTLQKPSGAPFNGHNLVAFTEAQGGATVADVINGNQGNTFWHGDFDSLKQSLLGIGDTTTYDISALDCPTAPSCPNGGLTLPQAVASQVAINPNQALMDPSYLAFQGQWADGTGPSPYLIPIMITTITPTSVSRPSSPTGFGIGCLNINDPFCKDPVDGPTTLPGGQGGQIVIGIDQTIRLERQAFNAVLGIGARTTLTNTVASIQILDINGNDASANFFVLITSDPLGTTHGGTVAGQTAVAWQLIPNAGAGGTSPQGALYQVRANLSYVVGGVAKSASTQFVTITVLPSPKLTVAYTAPFVVEAGKDIKIRVTLKNIGFGTAHNLSIQSMQPRVVATLPTDPLLDNPGPLVNFTISGSSNKADGSTFQLGNLTISFGDVAPGATVSGYWTLQVSQKGFFIDISSTFSHTDFQGIALDPLILTPTTTLIPAIGGTVSAGTGQTIPGLTVDVSQAGTVVGSDQTDTSGVYYIQDLTAGVYLEEVRDLTGAVLASKNITVLGNQATDFIDFVIPNYNPTIALVLVSSNPPGLPFTADGAPYTTPHSFQWSVNSTHTLGASSAINGSSVARAQALAASTPTPVSSGQTLVGWSDGETSATRNVTVGPFGATFTSLYRPTAEVNQYTRTQITNDLVDHKWPSMNNLGDMVWSEKDNAGYWQVVYLPGPSVPTYTIPCVAFLNGVCQVTGGAQNHERPVISDNGTIAWFQDNSGQGLGYAIKRLDPGSAAPSPVEYSSRNVFCPFTLDFFGNPIPNGPCNYQEHDAGKTFGIGSDGRTISFYTFTDTSNPPPFRRFNVTGIGRLPNDSSPDDFYGFESPDINKDSAIVFADGFPSSSKNIYLATTMNPLSTTVIDQGQYPHISDGPNPEITYLKNGMDVTHWLGAANPSKWVALGFWADIVVTGSGPIIVYECRVNGLSQICTAKPTPVFLTITSPNPQSGIVGAALPNPLVLTATNQQGVPVAGVGISYSITQQPAGAGGASLSPISTTTGSNGTGTTQFTLGDTPGQYQVTASCSPQSCTPANVVFTATGLSGIAVTTNVTAATFTITGPTTFSGGGTSFMQAGVPPGSYTITYGAVDGYNTPPSETKTLIPNGGISFVGTYVASIVVDLADPVPGLLNGPAITTNTDQVASNGSVVAGVAADGVTEVAVRIQAGKVGDQFTLAILNDQGQQSGLPSEDGALGNLGDTAFSLTQLTVSAVLTSQGPMAFAVYRAPIDFPRASGQDANATTRSVSMQVQLQSTGATTNVPVTILRPPVVLIHGIWDDSGLWNNFSPLFSNSSPDPRFSIFLAKYFDTIGPSIQASMPTFSVLNSYAKENALGFDYNSTKVFGQVQSYISAFKNGVNAAGIQAAAVQVDVVAHSMGGNITRYLALQPGFLSDPTFNQGNVHKVITIDTPHLGTPLAADDNHPIGQTRFGLLQSSNTCVRILFAVFGKFAFSSVTMNGGSVNGAVGDLQGDGFGGSLSLALQRLQAGSHPLPTALIAGVLNSSNLSALTSSLSAKAIRLYCNVSPLGVGPMDPLAQALTPTGWPTVFNQPSDAIVPLQSQLNGLSPSQGFQFFGYIHSDGTTKLGFGPPSITHDPYQLVPNLVINLLNTPVNDSVFVGLKP